MSFGTRKPCQWIVVCFRQRILEVHDDAVADLRADQRARHRAVVGPGRRFEAGQYLDVRHARLELDLEHVGIGVQIAWHWHRELIGPARGLADVARQLAAPRAGAGRPPALSAPAKSTILRVLSAANHHPQRFRASVCRAAADEAIG